MILESSQTNQKTCSCRLAKQTCSKTCRQKSPAVEVSDCRSCQRHGPHGRTVHLVREYLLGLMLCGKALTERFHAPLHSFSNKSRRVGRARCHPKVCSFVAPGQMRCTSRQTRPSRMAPFFLFGWPRCAGIHVQVCLLRPQTRLQGFDRYTSFTSRLYNASGFTRRLPPLPRQTPSQRRLFLVP